MGVEAALLGLVDARFGADAGRAADLLRVVGDADRPGLDVGVRQGHEARLGVGDVDQDPFGPAGLTVEVDLTNTAEPLPARIKDVAAGPIAVVAELGLGGQLSHIDALPANGVAHASGVGSRVMTDPDTLLERHRPRLVYDSQEPYFADSAAVWTDSPTNVLRRADGTVIAKPPKLSLDFLGAYKAEKGDAIGDTTRRYAQNAALLHAQPRYANRMYGHARRDRNGAVAPVLALLLLQRLPARRQPSLGRQARGRLGARPAPARRERASRPGRVPPAQAVRTPPVDQGRQAGRAAARVRRAWLARQLLRGRLALDRPLVRSCRRQRPQDRPQARDRRHPTPRSGCSGRPVGRHEAQGPAGLPTARRARVSPHWRTRSR